MGSGGSPVSRPLLRLQPTSFEGKHLRVEDGSLLNLPVQTPYPPLYFGGSSDVGMQVAATHVDTYLTWGEPPKDVAEKAVAATRGRRFEYGIRLHVIVRETPREAWAAADDLIKHADDETIAARSAR